MTASEHDRNGPEDFPPGPAAEAPDGEPGRAPTAEEEELFAWADAAHKSETQTLQRALDRLLTLTTALLAGSAALYTQLPVPAEVKAGVALLLTVSLGAALVGWMPWFAAFDPDSLKEIRRARARLANRKAWCLFVGTLCLGLAFPVLVSGLILGPAGGTHPQSRAAAGEQPSGARVPQEPQR